MNIISIIITQIPILGASALFAAGSVVMGIAKSKEVRANHDEDGGHDDGDGEVVDHPTQLICNWSILYLL